MKHLSILLVLFLAGCASATPIDFLIPTPKPSHPSQMFLGDLYSTNKVNKMYHSLADTKREKAMVPLADALMTGYKIVAQAELEYYDKVGTNASNGLWGLIVAGAGLMGWQIPRPQEKAKVTEALHKQPPQ